MKQISTDSYTFTEIGGVGEMIYKAVQSPGYVPEPVCHFSKNTGNLRRMRSIWSISTLIMMTVFLLRLKCSRF